MTSSEIVQYCLSGVSKGSIYSITAIGFNIIYNTTGIINFAQGEFLVIGAMTAISLTAVMPLALAVVCAVVITAIIGALIELVFIRWIKKPTVLRLIIITIGLSILLREAMLHIWDEKIHTLPFFTGSYDSTVKLFGAAVSYQVVWVLATSTFIVIALHLFFTYSLTGRAMRACASNRTAARLCGVNASRMVTLSFMLSAGIGALAGCVVSPLTQTQYDMGTNLAIKGFTVAIIGGLGNSTGAVFAGILLGLIEAFSVCFWPSAYRDAIALVILIVILVVKPSGLFGSSEKTSLKEF